MTTFPWFSLVLMFGRTPFSASTVTWSHMFSVDDDEESTTEAYFNRSLVL